MQGGRSLLWLTHVDRHSWKFDFFLTRELSLRSDSCGCQRAIKNKGDVAWCEDGVFKKSDIPEVIVFALCQTQVYEVSIFLQNLIQRLFDSLGEPIGKNVCQLTPNKPLEATHGDLNGFREVTRTVKFQVKVGEEKFYGFDVDLEHAIFTCNH